MTDKAKNFTMETVDGIDYAVFPDGTRLRTPPATEADRTALLSKVAEVWKPVCLKCGEVQSPVLWTNGRIAAACPECNRRRVLERGYSTLSDEQLRELRADIAKSTDRRLAVIDKIEARRREQQQQHPRGAASNVLR